MLPTLIVISSRVISERREKIGWVEREKVVCLSGTVRLAKKSMVK